MEQQAAGGREQRRHGLLMRWLLRAPVLVYRIGLGGLMLGRPMLGGLMPGHLMLTTVGRRSGRPHRVVVDMWQDTATDSYYVASGFGEHADWYRNLRANPEIRVAGGVAQVSGSCEHPACGGSRGAGAWPMAAARPVDALLQRPVVT